MAGRAVSGMNCLRPLKHWDRGLESHLKHGSMCLHAIMFYSLMEFYFVESLGSWQIWETGNIVSQCPEGRDIARVNPLPGPPQRTKNLFWTFDTAT
jgi:hypothetical protein